MNSTNPTCNCHYTMKYYSKNLTLIAVLVSPRACWLASCMCTVVRNIIHKNSAQDALSPGIDPQRSVTHP